MADRDADGIGTSHPHSLDVYATGCEPILLYSDVHIRECFLVVSEG
jgi:copper oxidase (laccase) domain-containing protein